VAYARNAQPVPVSLPVAGALRILDGDVRRPGVLVAVDSWTRAESIYSVGTLDSQVADTGLQATSAVGALADLVAEEVLVRSHDGLEVPLSIVHLKAMKLDGSNPVELDAYGAYGSTDTPGLRDRQLAWYELGGVTATCHVRGGGIHGENWHLAGKQLGKPNTWKDLIACAEYLVKKGYTRPDKLAISGNGAGGIAVGRALSARPDLFAVVVAQGGEFNSVRDERTANGPARVPEFGSVKDRAQFDALLEMDAFHHVEDGVKYPATLLLQDLDDPAVAAWESMKMAARLQAATTSGRPVLLRLPSELRQGVDSTGTQREEQDADIWSFMLWQFGDARFQPAAR
jgi:prolyl oligopeptidase